ncbi:flippase [Pseudoneobacillus sp. C159]
MKNKLLNIKGKLKKNHIFNKIIKNSSWMIFEKIFNMIIGVFVIGLLARYFGPENFGKYNYALAFVSLFTAFSTLGLETLAIKALIDNKYKEGTILFTSFILRMISGIGLLFIAITLIKIVEPNDQMLHILVTLISLTMVFKSLEVIDYWIQAHQKAKLISTIRIIVYILTSVLKILLVIMKLDLIFLAIIFMFEIIFSGILLVAVYIKTREDFSNWNFSSEFAKNILSQSWYLILSGLMVTIYMRIDQVMLGSLLNDKAEVGIYSAAVRIAEMWFFVPAAIITSFQPVIMTHKKNGDNQKYISTIQILYSIVLWISIFFGIFILLFSKTIVSVLYGQEFLKAASILSISVWAGSFAMLGSARGVWLVSEGLQRFSMFYISLGCVLNVILNYLLIPSFGGYGAAIATLFSQMTVAIIAPSFFKETRVSSKMIIKSLILNVFRKKSNKRIGNN